MKRILITHNHVAPYRLKLFERLNQVYNVTVLYGKRSDESRKWDTNLNDHLFKYIILKYIHLGPFIINYLLPIQLVTKKADVYIIAETPSMLCSSLLTVWVAKIRNKPVIVWVGDIDTDYSQSDDSHVYMPTTLFKLLQKSIEDARKYIYKNADAFVAYSDMSEQYLQDRGADPEVIFKGGQIVQEEQLPPHSFNSSTKENDQKFKILSLGYLERRKGIGDLITAFKNSDIPNSELIIAGSGPDRDRLESMAATNNNINFIGHVKGEEKARCYSEADVFVLPTHHDPWGLVINEAIHYGLPIIVTDAAGAVDLVRESQCGIIVDSGNPLELENALLKLYHNNSFYCVLQERAEEVSKHSDPEIGIRPFKRAIETVS
jgi:glycosyltransferase involved in cell wall biosynthesis